MSERRPNDRERRHRLLEMPASPETLLDLGVVAFQSGTLDARRWFTRAAAAAPDEASAHFAVAVTTPESPAAARHLSRALAIDPAYVPAWLERAAKGADTRSRSLFRAFAIEESVETAASVAGVLLDDGNVRRARVILDRSLQRSSQNANIWVNCGRVSVEEGDWRAGLRAMRRAIALTPAMFEAWMNFGAISEDWGDRADGAPAACRAVILEPTNVKARWNRTLALLGQGDWARGFGDHDVRLEIQKAYPHELAKPRWDGATMPGRLFIYDEIGYGDVFNFIRYLPMARARVGSLTFEVKPGLAQLLQGFPGIDRLTERHAEPPSVDSYDAHLPMESLPAIFATTVETIPPMEPALQAPNAPLRRWSGRLRGLRRPLVGLCWAGNRASGFDHKRSCAFSDFDPILSVSGVTFISLQKDTTEADARLLAIGHELMDFADTAAVIANLDLVITVETSVAHLVGAMGRPVWILLAPNPAWRWLADRPDTPWYPSARLFRRRGEESWLDLARTVANELRAVVA